MEKEVFEYRVDRISAVVLEFEKLLNALAQDGWEDPKPFRNGEFVVMRRRKVT